MNNLNLDSLHKSTMLSSIIGMVLIVVSFYLGKVPLFLLLNGNGGYWSDLFFTYCTYLGDGIIWVPFGLVTIFYRKKLWPLIISTIIISTLFVQLSKNVLVPNEPRPTNAITEINLIHTVTGVELHGNNSFPSGHTTTVFCIYLLSCLVVGGNSMIVIGFIVAALTGYSRIYLAQHFPLDVGAGMITAVLTVYLSLWIQSLFNRNKN